MIYLISPTSGTMLISGANAENVKQTMLQLGWVEVDRKAYGKAQRKRIAVEKQQARQEGWIE